MARSATQVGDAPVGLVVVSLLQLGLDVWFETQTDGDGRELRRELTPVGSLWGGLRGDALS